MVSALERAALLAMEDLFNLRKESFYYCALFTTGEGLAPFLSAWSKEALAREVAKSPDPAQAQEWLKWSWAESPYMNHGEGFFSEVQRQFSLRPGMSSLPSMDDKLAELQLRLACMEEAMARLDRRGLFGRGNARDQILINAEIVPPEYSNTERAVRLNPPGALSGWMVEYAEPPP